MSVEMYGGDVEKERKKEKKREKQCLHAEWIMLRMSSC